jgi:hypothetical protein
VSRLVREVLERYADQQSPPQVDVAGLLDRGRSARRRRRVVLVTATAVALAIGAVFAVVVPRVGGHSVQVSSGDLVRSPWADSEQLHLGTLAVPRPALLWSLVAAGDAAVYSTWNRTDGSKGEVFALHPDGRTTRIGGAAPGWIAADGSLVGWFEPAARSGGYRAVVYDVRANIEVGSREISVSDPGTGMAAPPVIAVDQDQLVYTADGQAWSWRWGGDGKVVEVDAAGGRVFDVVAGVRAIGSPATAAGEFAGPIRFLAEDGRTMGTSPAQIFGGQLDPTGRYALTVSELNGWSVLTSDGRVRELQLDGMEPVYAAWDASGRVTVAAVRSRGDHGTLDVSEMVSLGSCDPVTGECRLVRPSIGPAGQVKLADGLIG